uniref:UmuC domain-containing protein n=1 Tax=Angiostrongylus cantonensis TaxID=6313 RepID=A0A0K0DM48_ANGCA
MDELAARLECTRDLRRDCVHIDMDAYFAAVEMRDVPRLRTVPMAVGSSAMLVRYIKCQVFRHYFLRYERWLISRQYSLFAMLFCPRI